MSLFGPAGGSEGLRNPELDSGAVGSVARCVQNGAIFCQGSVVVGQGEVDPGELFAEAGLHVAILGGIQGLFVGEGSTFPVHLLGAAVANPLVDHIRQDRLAGQVAFVERDRPVTLVGCLVGARSHQRSLRQTRIIGMTREKVLPGSSSLDVILHQGVSFGQVVPGLPGLLVGGRIVQHAQVVGNGPLIVAIELVTRC